MFHLKKNNVFSVLLLLFFITSLPYVQNEYNLYYRALFAICVIVAIFQKEFLPIFFSKYSLPIIICLGVFFVFWWIDYGDRSLNTLLSFVRGFVVFVMVFVMARDIKNYQILLITFLISILFLIEFMMGGGILSSSIMGSRNEIVNMVAANLNLDQGDYKTAANHMIIIVAYVSFVSVLAFSFLDYSSKAWVKLLVFIPLILTFIFCLKTLWTAPVLILIVSLLLMRVSHVFFSGHKKTSQKHLKKITTVLMFSILFLGIALILSTFQTGEAYVRAERLRSFFYFVTTFGSTPFDFNLFSSGRVELSSESIAGFLSSPFFGVGDFTYSSYISNHSSILDVLARFGLVGFVPFICMFGFYSRLSYRLVRMQVQEEHWTHISIMTFFLVFFVSNIANPYMLTSSIELLFFSSAGYVSGRYSYLTKSGSTRHGVC